MAREIKGQVVSETEKYIYTIEVIHTPRTYYQVEFNRGYCCSVYDTREEAETDGPWLAKLFGDVTYKGVLERHDTTTEFKHHRYKK